MASPSSGPTINIVQHGRQGEIVEFAGPFGYLQVDGLLVYFSKKSVVAGYPGKGKQIVCDYGLNVQGALEASDVQVIATAENSQKAPKVSTQYGSVLVDGAYLLKGTDGVLSTFYQLVASIKEQFAKANVGKQLEIHPEAIHIFFPSRHETTELGKNFYHFITNSRLLGWGQTNLHSSTADRDADLAREVNTYAAQAATFFQSDKVYLFGDERVNLDHLFIVTDKPSLRAGLSSPTGTEQRWLVDLDTLPAPTDAVDCRTFTLTWKTFPADICLCHDYQCERDHLPTRIPKCEDGYNCSIYYCPYLHPNLVVTPKKKSDKPYNLELNVVLETAGKWAAIMDPNHNVQSCSDFNRKTGQGCILGENCEKIHLRPMFKVADSILSFDARLFPAHFFIRNPEQIRGDTLYANHVPPHTRLCRRGDRCFNIHTCNNLHLLFPPALKSAVEALARRQEMPAIDSLSLETSPISSAANSPSPTDGTQRPRGQYRPSSAPGAVVRPSNNLSPTQFSYQAAASRFMSTSPTGAARPRPGPQQSREFYVPGGSMATRSPPAGAGRGGAAVGRAAASPPPFGSVQGGKVRAPPQGTLIDIE